MPRPGQVCGNARCFNLKPCAAHPSVPFATARRSSNLYGTERWKRERLAFLKQHPLCTCGARATVVDHHVRHFGNETAFWDQSNWRALCWPCHQCKTGRETRERVNGKALR